MYCLAPVAPKASSSRHPRTVTRRKEAEPDTDIEEILRCDLGLDGPVTLEGLEHAHNMVTWHLESSAREIRLITQEREISKKELIALEKEIARLEHIEDKQ